MCAYSLWLTDECGIKASSPKAPTVGAQAGWLHPEGT